MLRRLAVCSFALLVLVLPPILAETAPSVKTKTTSVAAFKNGLGFFVREGTATLTDGWATSDEVPTAALGTFWVGSPKPGVSVERLLALQEDSTRTVPAVTVVEMLEANVGKRVKITYGDKVLEGALLAVPEDRKPPAQGQPYPTSSYSPSPPESQLVLIETASGTVAISKSSVSMVEFEGKVSADHQLTEKVKRLKFKVAGAENSAPITIGYLQKGISWSPAYLVELLDDKKARITMQGLLVNDVEDIDGADVSFVVGYPNFMFSDIVSPLALTQSISQFVDSLANPSSRSRSGGYGGYGGVMAQSVAYNTAGYDYSGQPSPDFGYSSMKETPGAQEEDLFLYHMTDVSLKKGERAYYTVFSAEAPFEHVYKWTVNDTSGIQPSGYVSSDRDNSDVKPPEDQVWHTLKLTNNLKFPWTTAPAMAMSKGKPLAQDTLSYTPKGGEGDLRLTIATDIRAKKSEFEKTRENNAININSSSFTKVTSEGKLTLKSFKSTPVTVQVTKTIIGEVTSAGLNGKIDKAGVEIRAVNPTSIVTWDVPLDPGEEKALDYAYFTYVRY